MNSKEFFEKVAQLRNVQQKCEQFRYPHYNVTRIKLEGEIDAEIARVREIEKIKKTKEHNQINHDR